MSFYDKSELAVYRSSHGTVRFYKRLDNMDRCNNWEYAIWQSSYKEPNRYDIKKQMAVLNTVVTENRSRSISVLIER